jgi:hypothetical protein
LTEILLKGEKVKIQGTLMEEEQDVVFENQSRARRQGASNTTLQSLDLILNHGGPAKVF